MPLHENEEDCSIKAAQAAARGTLMTLVLRLVSFGCTQWTIRVLDASTLGKANIQLELLLTTVLFVSREGFRLSMTRNIAADNFNLAWFTIPLSTLMAGTALTLHLYMHRADDDPDRDFWMAGIFYCFASWLEGCAEPAVLFLLRDLDVASRVSAESFATVFKTLTTVVGLGSLRSSFPVTAMGISQVVYAAILFVILYWRTWGLLPGPQMKRPDWALCKMTAIFTAQGLFKHFLTEADRIVLSAISDSYDQGVYAMGSAYGGMAARILLQPLEENSRLLWSRLAQSKSSSKKLEESYVVLVKLVMYIGLLFSCLAVNYTQIVLNVLAGRKWGSNQEAIAVLSAFCIYTSFLAGTPIMYE
jgi:oligosaccharide translocation protein RFT1